MRTERVSLIVGIVLVLGVGMPIAQILPQSGQPVNRPLGENLWRARSVDLMVQLGLVFVGALGVRALLPPEDETD